MSVCRKNIYGVLRMTYSIFWNHKQRDLYLCLNENVVDLTRSDTNNVPHTSAPFCLVRTSLPSFTSHYLWPLKRILFPRLSNIYFVRVQVVCISINLNETKSFESTFFWEQCAKSHQYTSPYFGSLSETMERHSATSMVSANPRNRLSKTHESGI